MSSCEKPGLVCETRLHNETECQWMSHTQRRRVHRVQSITRSCNGLLRSVPLPSSPKTAKKNRSKGNRFPTLPPIPSPPPAPATEMTHNPVYGGIPALPAYEEHIKWKQGCLSEHMQMWGTIGTMMSQEGSQWQLRASMTMCSEGCIWFIGRGTLETLGEGGGGGLYLKSNIAYILVHYTGSKTLRGPLSSIGSAP